MYCFLRVVSGVVVTALKMLPLKLSEPLHGNLCAKSNGSQNFINHSSFCLVDLLSHDLVLCMWKAEVKRRKIHNFS